MDNKIFSIIQRNYDKIDSLSTYEKSVFEKILNCRTEPVPFLFSRCDCCSSVHPVYKSCKDRMCPICNGSASVKWAAKREFELLPTDYFLLTYTVPSQLRSLFLINKKICYDLLFKSVSRSLLENIRNNDRTFHGEGGFFAVLHTCDQRLNYHPHLHVVVPAGCLSNDSTKWIASHPSFFLPVKKMSVEFRRKLLLYLRKKYRAGSLKVPKDIDDMDMLFEKLNNISWVVHSQPPGKKRKPEHVFRYLSRYGAKSAVSEKRIQKIENGNVYVSYYDRKKKQRKTEILAEMQFMKRLIMHFLPKGFKKVRFYGFMANRYRVRKLCLCRMLLGQPITEQEDSDKKLLLNDTAFLFWKYFNIDITRCGKCGKGHMQYIRRSAGGG